MDHVEYARLRAAVETAHESGRFTFALTLVTGLFTGWMVLVIAAVADLFMCVLRTLTWPFRVVWNFCDTTYCIIATYYRVSKGKSDAKDSR